MQQRVDKLMCWSNVVNALVRTQKEKAVYNATLGESTTLLHETQSTSEGSNGSTGVRVSHGSSCNSLNHDLVVGTSTMELPTNDNHLVSFLGNTSFNGALSSGGNQGNSVRERVDQVGVDALEDTTGLTSDRSVGSQANDVTSRTVEGKKMNEYM